MGSPWEPDEDDAIYIELLEKSLLVHGDSYLSSENYDLPDNYWTYFNEERYGPITKEAAPKNLK